MMGILSFISGLFQPAVDLIDEIHVSDQERMELQNKLAEIQEKANSKILDYESKIIEANAKIQVAEAGSKHLITSIWRPVTCVVLVTIILLDGHFGFTASPNVYELAKVFLGVYGTGRSLEKLGSVIKLGK